MRQGNEELVSSNEVTPEMRISGFAAQRLSIRNVVTASFLRGVLGLSVALVCAGEQDLMAQPIERDATQAGDSDGTKADVSAGDDSSDDGAFGDDASGDGASGGASTSDDEPSLPSGLDDEPSLPSGLDDEPSLPSGLDDEPSLPGGLDGEPSLPTGLDEGTEAVSTDESFSLPLSWKIVVDLRGGTRIREPINQRRLSLGEARLQMHADKDWELWAANLSLTVDYIADPVLADYGIDLETGAGAIDIREVSLVLSPLDFIDLKIGRQTLTWGTGDLLFINDMFPKDWNAFIIGREIDYLKAPSDAVKLSAFHSMVNVDLVLTPRFDADRYPDRARISSYDPATGAILGQDSPIVAPAPGRWGRDSEVAVRAYREIKRFELAAYGYRGYWKSPAGMNPSTGEATFPKLSVYGASARGSLYGGIVNVETGYYDSRTDRSGDDPFVRNSEVRSTIGFERELVPGVTVGLQYYQEYMRSHGNYKKNLPQGAKPADRIRHLATARVSTTAMRERMRIGLFVMGSPNEMDLVLLPTVSYALSDQWRVHVAANIFQAEENDAFFGQLESNSSVSGGLRGTF